MRRQLLVRLAVLALWLSAAGVAGAQSEVHNPWQQRGPTETQPTRTPPPPPAAGDQVALLPVPDELPAWAFGEVLNPWGDDQVDRGIKTAERPLMTRARARAARLAACFPASHRHYRYWASMRFGRTPVVRGAHPEIDRCIGRAVSNLGRRGDYTLVLRFDPEGLREVFVAEAVRIPTATRSPAPTADPPARLEEMPF